MVVDDPQMSWGPTVEIFFHQLKRSPAVSGVRLVPLLKLNLMIEVHDLRRYVGKMQKTRNRTARKPPLRDR